MALRESASVRRLYCKYEQQPVAIAGRGNRNHRTTLTNGNPAGLVIRWPCRCPS